MQKLLVRFFVLLLSLFLFFPQAANAGLVGWWKMDEASWNGTANEVIDSAGANHGTSSGGATTKVGKIDRAGNFDGTNDVVNAGTPASLNNITVKTVSAWIYPTDLSGTGSRRVVDKEDGGKGWLFGPQSTDDSLLYIQGFTTGFYIWTTPASSIATNQWQHIVVAYDNSSLSNNPVMYINGVLQSVAKTETASGTRSDDSDKRFGIGGIVSAASNMFPGLIDDVRIYDHALTANEVAELYYLGANTRMR